MRSRRSRGARRWSGRRGAVIVEFALVVPFLFLIVFGIIDFSRAYAQLNAINSALREGARYASTLREIDYTNGSYVASVKARVQNYATVFGYNSLDMSKVSVTTTSSPGSPIEFITVTVTAHPLPLPVLRGFIGVPPLTVTRSVSYRWERAGVPSSSP
jgi:Flp pilus assembly protein TadG